MFAAAAIVACLALGSGPGEASSVNLEPNAKFTLEFPELPATYFERTTGNKTPPLLSAQLPENYSADGTFPLFVFIDGGNGGPGRNASFARDVIGPRDFIAVNMPLFKDLETKAPTLLGVPIDLGGVINSSDIRVLGSSYRVMLEKLAQTIPNIASERNTMGGFSNGAHATSVLVAAKDEFILKRFTAFVLLEGGIGLMLKPAALRDTAMKGRRFLILFGDQDKDPKLQALRSLFLGPMLRSIAQEGAAAQLDVTQITMRGHGHEHPMTYLKLIGAWSRGDKLPEVD